MTKAERREYYRAWRESHREQVLVNKALYRRRKRAERARLKAMLAKPNAPVTVEVRGGIVTEWRGQRVIGGRAADHIRHS